MLHDQHSYRHIIRKRNLILKVGFAISLGLIFLAFQWKAPMEDEIKKPSAEGEVITIENITPRTQIQEEKQLLKMEEITPPKPKVDDIIIKEVENPIDKKKKGEFKLSFDDVLTSNVPDEIVINPVVKRQKPVRVAEVMPEFPGGLDAMNRFIQENFEVPRWMQGLDETIHLEFIVDEEGKITHVKVLRGSVSMLNKEAVRVLEKMPKWSPGMQGDREVRVIYSVPIKIKTQ